jgi:DNA polymerase-3 subunit delta'
MLPIVGHDAERHILGNNVASGELPASLLVHGPAGVGKQRLALWLAQRIVCERSRDAEPCGQCQPCKLALKLEHPDVHWYFPLVRPKGSADRLGDALEEARGAELAARRDEPLRATLPAGMVGIFLAQVQNLLRAAGARPAMGNRKVFIVGDAEFLVPQESSPEAANALLKVLEEPPPGTTIILTTSEPELLLPTIRSRLLPIRLRRLPDTMVRDFLVANTDAKKVKPADLERAARLGAGSIGKALGYIGEKGDDSPLDELRKRAKRLLEAAVDTSSVDALSLALAESPAGARGEFSDTLESLTIWLRDLAAADAGADDVINNTDELEWLRNTAARLPHAGAGVPAAIRAVDRVQQLTQFNINPQLATAWLLREIRHELAVSQTNKNNY